MNVQDYLLSLGSMDHRTLVGVPPKELQRLLDEISRLKRHAENDDAAIEDYHEDLERETNRRKEAEADRNAALMLVAKIREAVGDPTGKLMQEDLIEHCRELRRRANQ